MTVNTLPKIKALNTEADIPKELLGTPFEDLIRYQNFEEPFKEVEKPELLVAMCMDNRKRLNIPERFAYITRTGGGNVRNLEFCLSFAIGVGGVTHIALVSHTDCGMVGLASKRDKFIEGMIARADWNREATETFFQQFAPFFEIGDPVLFSYTEYKRLAGMYPGIKFYPFLYKVEDNKLYAVQGD